MLWCHWLWQETPGPSLKVLPGDPARPRLTQDKQVTQQVRVFYRSVTDYWRCCIATGQMLCPITKWQNFAVWSNVTSSNYQKSNSISRHIFSWKTSLPHSSKSDLTCEPYTFWRSHPNKNNNNNNNQLPTNKKALLSQRRPRDVPNIWVPWKVSRVLANAPGYFSRNL